MVYHYTMGQNWKLIDESGELRPSLLNIQQGERPAVSFTRSSKFDGTAIPSLVRNGQPRRLTLLEAAERAEGLYRIAVDEADAPLTWHQYVKQAPIPAKIAKRLVVIANAEGAFVEDYRFSFPPVPRSKWLSVETFVFEPGRFESGKWEPIPPNGSR